MMLRLLAFSHGFYYLVTGIWSLVDIKSFMVVTGSKYDIWLVKMVGLLTISISLMIITMGIRNKSSREGIILILASCVSYMSIDIYYVLKGTISIIYLADAVAEIILVVFWITWMYKNKGTYLHQE